MRVLMAHNYYQEPGGEDASFHAEADLLEAYGHEVIRHTVHNDEIDAGRAARVGARAVWSKTSYDRLRALVRQTRPDVAHFQNTFPLLSPSAYYAVRREGVPVVQSLRNYRLACLNATFFRDGRPCEDCLGRTPLPGIVHACYRGNRPASAAVAGMLVTHRLLGTWSREVDLFVALTGFARDKLAEALPDVPIVVKPNFVYPDPGTGPGDGGFALFVGRLAPEKGLETLVEAWRRVGRRLPLRIVGDGPLRPYVEAAAAEVEGITYEGRLERDATYRAMGRARCLVVTSTWYETFGRVAIEAFASGTPVIASDIGALAEVACNPEASVVFAPGDPADLARKVERLVAEDRLGAMRPAARAEYERKYSPERNHDLLLGIYERARR